VNDNSIPLPGAPEPEGSKPAAPKFARVTVAMEGIETVVVDAAACLVVCNPDPKNLRCQFSFVHAPSGMHLTVLVASALAQLRKSYGEVAVRQAIESELQFKVEANYINTIKKPGAFDGPIGGGRLG
jgi:hypothetical protein